MFGKWQPVTHFHVCLGHGVKLKRSIGKRFRVKKRGQVIAGNCQVKAYKKAPTDV